MKGGWWIVKKTRSFKDLSKGTSEDVHSHSRTDECFCL